METPLAILLWTTLSAAAIGLVATVCVAARRDGRASLLLLPFAAVAVLQVLLMPELRRAAIGFDLPTLQAGSLLLAVVGSFAALLALARIVRERNAAEDLHWDSMQALRALNELALPGLGQRQLDELLAIGARHFEMDFAAVLPRGGGAPLALHRANENTDVDAVLEALSCYAERESDRTLLDEQPAWSLDAPLSRVFLTGLCRDERSLGQIAFASLAPGGRTLTATDKDLLGLLAHHASLAVAALPVAVTEPVAAEPAAAPLVAVAPADDAPAPLVLPRPLPPAPLPPPPVMAPDPPPPPAPPPSLTQRLRAGLGSLHVDLDLAPDLERAGTPAMPLEDVLQDLVAGARAISRHGPLRVESGSTRSPQGDAHFLTLTVHIQDPALAAHTLDSASSRGALASLGKRLRVPGGDVSISVESGVGASMTAYVPIRPPDTDERAPAPLPHYAS